MLFSPLFILLVLCGTAATASENYTIADIPKCSLTCLLDSLPITTCGVLDFDCQCKSGPLFDAVTKCSLANCTLSESIILSKIQAIQCRKPIESKKSYVRGWIIALMTITSIHMLLRLYSCRAVRGGFFKDDYLVLAGVLCSYALGGLLSLMVNNGLGVHIYQIEEESSVSKILKYFWASEVLYVITLACSKSSLVVFFLRIFPQRRFRIACYNLIAAIILLNLIRVLLLIFQCTPVSAGWDLHTVHPKCYRIQLIAYVGAGSNMVQDLTVLVFPIPLLLKLKITIGKKIALLAMFSIGMFVVLTSLLRLKSVKHFGTSADPTWDNVPIAIWTALEIHVAILCCNLPPIAALVAHYKRGILGTVRELTTNLSDRGGRSGDATGRRSTWLNSNSDSKQTNTSVAFTKNADTSECELQSTGSVELSDSERTICNVSWHGRYGRVYTSSQTMVTSPPICETPMADFKSGNRWHEARVGEPEQTFGDGIVVSRSVVVKNELKVNVGNMDGSAENQDRLCDNPVLRP